MSHKRFITMILMIVMIIYSINPLMIQAQSLQKTELTILCNQSEVDMSKYKEGFEAKNPDVELVYIYSPDYEEQALKDIHSGDYADVLFIPGGLDESDFSKYLEPMGEVGTLSKNYNYIDSSAQHDNFVYGIPAFCWMSGFVYNNAVFQQAGVMAPPKDMESFLDALQKVKDNTDAIPFYTNYNSPWALSVWETFPFIEMTGKANYKYNEFITKKDPFTMDSSHGEVYSLLGDIVEEKLCEQELGCYEWDQTKSMINKGEIACMAIGSWALSQFKNAGENEDDVSFMAFPNMIDGKQYASVVTDYCYGINVNSENKELARKYIDYMLNESMYAIEHDTISVVKTDPLPDSYANMENIVLLPEKVDSYTGGDYYRTLSSKLNLSDGKEQIRIMDAAAKGYSEESLEDIFRDWNDRWEQSRTSEMEKDDIVSDYFDDIEIEQNREIEFSEREKKFLDSFESVKVGYLDYFAPFTHTKDHQFAGVFRDLFDYFNEIVDKEIKYVPYQSYGELYTAIENGEIDIIAAMEDNNQYASKLKLTKSAFTFNNIIVKGKNVSLEEYSNKKIACYKKNGYLYANTDKNVVETDSILDSFESVSRNYADYMVSNYYTANYYINSDKLSNLSYLTMSSKTKICIALSNMSDTCAMSVINKCLYSLTDSQIEGMLVNNMDPEIQRITISTLIKLYPLVSIMVIIVIFLAIISVIIYVYSVRNKNMKRLTIEAQRYQILADLSNEYLFEFDMSTNQISFDKKYVQNLGFPSEIMLENGSYGGYSEGVQAFMESFHKIREFDDTHEMNFVLPYSGTNDWYKMILFKVDSDKGLTLHIIGKIVNIQKEIDRQSKLINKAERDKLTGLLNRDGFESVCEQMINSDSFPEFYGYAVLDMDNFKGINDLFGHAGGDEALKLLADTLSECFEGVGIVSRFGGDEFIVLLTGTGSAGSTSEALDTFVKKMHQVFRYEGKEREISVSLGAVWLSSEKSLDEAFKLADEQLYKVKQKGKNNFLLTEVG